MALYQDTNIENTEKKEIRKTGKRMGRVSRAVLLLMLKCGLIAAAAAIILNCFVTVRIWRGIDMFPLVMDGDCVFIALTDDVTFNDVILYEAGGKEHLGRIVAVPGEEVVLDGGLWVDGGLEYSQLPYRTEPRNGETFRDIVPEDAFYVLGDLREQSEDSRDFGFIRKSQIIGRQAYLMRWRGF